MLMILLKVTSWLLLKYVIIVLLYLIVQPHVSRGQIFNLSSYTESVRDVAQSVADHLGSKVEISFVKPTDPFGEALGLHQRVSSHKAKTLLGWVPKKPTVVDGVETYYHAWKAQ
jgi:nucleoside-diphosphate-sugar epimerase